VNSNAFHLFAITALLSICSIACRSTAPQATKQEFALSDQQLSEDAPDEFEDEEDEEATEVTTPSSQSRTHPKEATAWSTRRLIMTANQPNPDAIQNCLDTVESLARRATNLEALADAAADLRSDVAKDKTMYHWCFYQMMASLDEKLEQPISLMDEKAELFLDKMSRLWILAGALDGNSRSSVYTKYLRSRYTNISLQTFGRLLENMDSGVTPTDNSTRGKSAGYFFDE
jgi:hypothetical protein